jgi:hypothetical protein
MAARVGIAGTLNARSEVLGISVGIPGGGPIAFVNDAHLTTTTTSAAGSNAFTMTDLLAPAFQATVTGPTGGSGPAGYTWGDVLPDIDIQWRVGSSGSISISPAPRVQQTAFPEDRLNWLINFSALASTSGNRTDVVRLTFLEQAPPSPMVFVEVQPGGVYTYLGYEWETASVLNLAFSMTGATAGQSYTGVFALEIISNTAPTA